MTKAQFLTALGAMDFVSKVGTPELLETKPDGTKWYSVNLREVKGDACVYRNVNFYVVDEGKAGEAAFFKDEKPIQSVRTKAFYDWMKDAIKTTPDDFKGVQVNWVSEELEMVIYSKLETSGSDLVWKTYYLRKDSGVAPMVITNHNPAYLSSVLAI